MHRRLASAAALVLLALSGAACATGSDGGDSAEPSSELAGGQEADRDAAAEQPADGVFAGDEAAASTSGSGSDNAGSDNAGSDNAALQQAVISNGNVAMKSDDVAQAIFDVRKVVDFYRGEVQEDTTETDDDGDPLRSRMVLRIPAGQFHQAMEELEKVGILITSSSNSKDVTTTVLDKQVRIRIQKRSIARIAVLLDRATSIRDIVNIEAQLSHREAELASLERQQRYLADQTSMSTITVSIERTQAKKPPETKEKDETGFLAGLAAGWDGLRTFGTVLATILGALLPWLVTLAILAIPGWPLVRRLRRREAVATPVAEPGH